MHLTGFEAKIGQFFVPIARQKIYRRVPELMGCRAAHSAASLAVFLLIGTGVMGSGDANPTRSGRRRDQKPFERGQFAVWAGA